MGARRLGLVRVAVATALGLAPAAVRGAGDGGVTPRTVAAPTSSAAPVTAQPPAVKAAAPTKVTTSAPAKVATSACVQDDQVPTPRGWQGWDRTAVIAWQAVEQAGGIVPDIEEDRGHAPPAWWRYPSAARSEGLLEAEARDPTMGLYRAVAPGDIAKGDILVRTRGAGVGVCGKMAVLGGQVEDAWVTLEVDPENKGPSSRPSSPLFFSADGKSLLPETRAFRIRVRNEETIGHIRELRRDLDHLERTVAQNPPRLAGGDEAREVVTQKVHDLIDEAWSLVAEEAFDTDRRELAGRALVLGAYLGWPAAAPSAGAVLDDVLRRVPGRAAAVAAQSLLARVPAAKVEPGAGEAQRQDGIRYFATAEEVGIESKELGFQARWPLTWRLMGVSANAETGVLANLVTGRVLLPDGHADRGTAVLLAQRPEQGPTRAVMVRDGARKMFPAAKLKSLPAVVPGSRRQEFRERQDGVTRMGEVTTLDRGGVVTFLVLNAPGDVYPKLRNEYTSFVKSVGPLGAGADSPPAGSAAPGAAVPPPSTPGPGKSGSKPAGASP